jgi:hypothetical protein
MGLYLSGSTHERKILESVYEAIEVEKSGLQLNPEKFQPLPIPALLTSVRL